MHGFPDCIHVHGCFVCYILCFDTICNKDSSLVFKVMNGEFHFTPEESRRIKEDLIRRMRGELTEEEKKQKEETEKAANRFNIIWEL